MENWSARLPSSLDGARDFVADGGKPPTAEDIVWAEQALPRVMRTVRMAAPIGMRHRTIYLAELSDARAWTIAGEIQVQWEAEFGAQRLIAEAAPDAAPINAVVLPLDEAFETRLDAARQFWRALNGKPSRSFYGALPHQTTLRHILNLRAHDGRSSGATQRQIAETLLAREPIASRDWRDHHLRHKVRAILRRADRLVAGGYRDLLVYPHSRSRL